MREFSALEERRKAGLLSAADELRWNELRQGLGQPEPAATHDVAAQVYADGYYAADGQWYPYDQQQLQWSEQYPGWAWDPVQQQWVQQQNWDPQDPGAYAASSYVETGSESDPDVIEVSSDEVTLIDEGDTASAVARAEEDAPTVVDADDIVEEVPQEEGSSPDLVAGATNEASAGFPATASRMAEAGAASDVHDDRQAHDPMHESISGALLAGVEMVANSAPAPTSAAEDFRPSAVFADLVPEAELPSAPEPAPVAAAPEELPVGALFGDFDGNPDDDQPILEARPEEIIAESGPEEDLSPVPMEHLVSDDELLTDNAVRPPRSPIELIAELSPTEPEQWIVRESGKRGIEAIPRVPEDSEILAVDIELEGKEDTLELTEEVVEPEQAAAAPPHYSAAPSADLLSEPAPDLLSEPSRIAHAPLASLQPSWISGEHRVVIHTSGGKVRRGIIRDADLLDDTIAVAPPSGAAPEQIPTESVKAIFFMLPSGSRPLPLSGMKLRVTFNDGRKLAGFSEDYSPQDPGFFLVPADNRTHTARVFIYRSSVESVVAA